MAFKNVSKFHAIAFLLMTITVKNGLAFLCPPSDLLAPCTCDDTGTLSCQGDELTHEHLRRVFGMLRTVNLVGEFHWLNVTSFTLSNTNIETLDIRFLANHTSFTNLVITANAQMMSIILPAGSWPWRAAAENVNLTQNGFKKDGLNLMFSLLAKSVLSLDLSQNQIEGFTGRKIVDSLPFLTQLKYLSLSSNLLTTLSASPFIHNSRLTELDLSNNRIGQLGRNTFEFEAADVDLLDMTLTINLSGNQLTDGQVSADSALASVGRPIQLYLQNNNFVFISAQNFETFLFVDFTNGLYLNGNTFICDARMKYLKDARAILEERVLGVDCVNDPGYTIFTTDGV